MTTAVGEAHRDACGTHRVRRDAGADDLAGVDVELDDEERHHPRVPAAPTRDHRSHWCRAQVGTACARVGRVRDERTSRGEEGWAAVLSTAGLLRRAVHALGFGGVHAQREGEAELARGTTGAGGRRRSCPCGGAARPGDEECNAPPPLHFSRGPPLRAGREHPSARPSDRRLDWRGPDSLASRSLLPAAPARANVLGRRRRVVAHAMASHDAAPPGGGRSSMPPEALMRMIEEARMRDRELERRIRVRGLGRRGRVWVTDLLVDPLSSRSLLRAHARAPGPRVRR